MSRHFPWTTLGIDATQDTAAIRKAYANVLRGLNVDEDIAGYAALRRARDEALWLAAQGEREDEGDYGLGGLGGLEDEGTDVDADYDGDWEDAPGNHRPEPLHDAPAPELSEAQAQARDAWQALTDLLYPDGAPSDESVTYAEMEAGLAHLAVLLDHAGAADLAEHNALDHALADVFANTWPRSAPFVEPANAALHWLDEAGSLEERPALMFLNARLKGMRFHEKVEQSDHPLHKAWKELARPGSASVIDRLRIKRLEVDKLLTGVRQHYPELESYLDPQRVASWEGTSAGYGVGDTGPKVVRGVVILLLVLAVPRLIAQFTDPRPDGSAAPIAALIDVGPSDAEVDTAVADIFGAGVDMNGARAADPVFADQLRNAFNAAPFSDNSPLAFARRKALEAGEVADFDTLIARAELRRLWLTAAARQPAGVCQNVLVGDFTTIPLELNDTERIRESTLLRKLLDAGVLSHQAKGESFSYTVPGWMVSELIDRSGLSDADVRKAMDDGTDANRCKVDGVLLDLVIANPGRVSAELLKAV